MGFGSAFENDKNRDSTTDWSAWQVVCVGGMYVVCCDGVSRTHKTYDRYGRKAGCRAGGVGQIWSNMVKYGQT
jgi:hypothetical protein